MPAVFRGVAAKLSPKPARQKTPSTREVSVLCFFAFAIEGPRARVKTRRYLGYRKRSTLCERLITIFIRNFDPYRIRAGSELLQAQAFLEGHLGSGSIRH